jgi:hypothetical protein
MTRLERITSVLGAIGGMLALSLFLLAIVSGSSQGLFQINWPSNEYAVMLVSRATYLRADLGLDFLFLSVYAAYFVFLCAVLTAWQRRDGAPAELTSITRLATGALVLTALLDAVENSHLLAVLSMAEQGMPISQNEIAWQQVESQVKFLASSFGILLFSFVLPSKSLIEKITVFGLRWVQLPLGCAIFVVPLTMAKPLIIARAIFFFIGLWATAWIVFSRSRRSSSNVGF